MSVRRQLSLFLPPDVSSAIETVRQHVDPVQFSLIPAHITLCREHELDNLAEIIERIRISTITEVELWFGDAEEFSGHGILMPCISGLTAFRQLREYLLDNSIIKEQIPHLTLAHPRNPKAEQNSLDATKIIETPLSIKLHQVSLIEQTDSNPWQVLDVFNLGQ